jgi:SagB-type dehydrogenase family enzyme
VAGAAPPRRGPRRLRRARALAVTWQDGRLTFENYLTRQVVSAEPLAVEVLGFFENWRAPGELEARLPEYRPASLRRALATLTAHTLLVREGSAEAERDQLLAAEWRDWLPQAGYHFATKDAPFASPRRWRRLVQSFLAESPQPDIFKTYPQRPQLRLPPLEPGAAPERDFARVLLARRTHREFSGAPLPLERIGQLLGYTWGTTGDFQSPNFGRLLRKTSPSGGARHPGEVYLVANAVDGVRPGLYHYNVRDHALEELRRGPLRERMLDYAVGQQHVGEAAAVFLMTAVWARSIWKYRSPRAYRVVTLDAGHLAQTFCLVATWLGLAPFTTAAMRDTAIEAELGIDGITESVLYIAGVGMPATTSARATGSAPSAAARPRAVAGRPRRRPRS